MKKRYNKTSGWERSYESETNDEKSDAHGNRPVDLAGGFIDGAGRDYAAET